MSAASSASSNVIVLTEEQLESIVRRAIRAERAADGAPAPPAEDREVLTLEQCAALLQVHPKVAARYVKTRGLPARKLGRDWRFKRSEVLRWLETEEPARPLAKATPLSNKRRT